MGNPVLKLRSGFELDFSNLYGPGLVTPEELAGLGGRLAEAHAAVEHMRATGEVRGHLSKDGTPEKVLFSTLPYVADGALNSPALLARLAAFGETVGGYDTVVSFGIGGSYLGNKVLSDVHGGEFWNVRGAAARGGRPRLFFSGQNLDPRRTEDLVRTLEEEAHERAAACGRVLRVMLVVISKSGSTVDTLAPFMVVYDRLRRLGVPVEVAVTAVTGPEEGEKAGILKRLAEAHGWPCFTVPDGVGGRFSVLSEVGLVTAACVGFDIAAFLAGARAMDEACRSADPHANPAMLNAALKYLASERHGRDIEVFMPYGDYLKSVAEWYVQLLAESLGKRLDRRGDEAFYGRTPIVAVGTTDMHAQTQQHQDGKKDKLVQFVRVAGWEHDAVIPDLFPEEPFFAGIAGLRLSQALEAARVANAEALIGDGRFNACFTLPALNAFHLGELLYLLMLSVAYEGELADVDAFDQPGVEAYKRIMQRRLKEYKG